MIEVRLLGPPTVVVDGAPVAFDTRKAVALLAVLALSERPRPRDVLADLLWGEGDEQHARGALRRTLSAVRRGAGPDCLDADRNLVGLKGEPEVVVDVRRARAAAAASDLELAASLHEGAFLEGLTVSGAPGFEEWQRATAEALRLEQGSVLRRLVGLREDGGDLRGALAVARRWLALDGLHEPAHQTVIRLTAATGDRGAAMVRYRECVRILDRELGVTPLAETTALYEAVRHRDAEAPSPPAHTPTEPVPATPLVGREQVLQALAEAYAGVRSSGRVVVIEGEAGIGRTRVAEELLARVRSEGTLTMATRAFEEESSLSYAPVAQALRSRLLQDPDWGGQLSHDARQAAGRLVPELAAGRRAAPLDSRLPGAEERFLSGLWEALAPGPRSGAGVFVLDDAQWADEATLGLLAYGSRRLTDRRLLLVLTWRTPSERPVRRVLTELQRSGEAAVHRLGRLDLAEMTDVVRVLRPAAAEPELLRRLFLETEGLPYLLVEYLRVLDVSRDQWSIPEGARELMRARVGQVSEVGRQVLAAAAVIGRSFDAEAVRLTSGRAEEEVVTGLEELVGHGLVREGTDSYDFSHETLRTLVTEDMSLARRRLLHRRAAQVSDDAASEARHLQLAGESGGAASAHVRAADQAQHVFAHAEALTHLRAALGLGHPDASALELRIAELLTRLGDYPAAVASLERAAAVAEPDLVGTIEHRLGQVHHRSGSWALAQAHLRSALAATPSERDGERARITADLSLAVLSGGDAVRARTLAAEALEIAEAADDLGALAQAHNLLGLLSSRVGAASEALSHLESSLTLAVRAGDGVAQVAALNNLALAHRATGSLTAAVERTREALALCVRQADRHREAALHNNLADLLHAQGEAEDAMHHLKLAVSIFADVGAAAGGSAEIWKLVQW